MYRVSIKLQKEEWKFGSKNEKCCKSRRQVFPQLFRVLQNFHEVFLQLDRNTENMFSISFRKHRNEKGNNFFYFVFLNQSAHTLS